MIGRILAAMGAAAILALGTGALVAPLPAARGYGIDVADPDALALVRALGARDCTLGIILGAAALRDDRTGIAVACGACILIAVTDASVVAQRRGMAPQLAVHASGIVALIAALALAKR